MPNGLTWRATWPDKPDRLDATAAIEGFPAAHLRVYLSESVPGDHRWYWVAADGDGKIDSGYAPDQKAAARCAVAAWKARKPD